MAPVGAGSIPLGRFRMTLFINDYFRDRIVGIIVCLELGNAEG
jgi:hypothetical protein